MIKRVSKLYEEFWNSNSDRSDASFGFLFFFTFCLLVYPSFFFFTRSPLIGGTNELNDPVVSALVYAPAIETIRYELLKHGTLLWSSLRGLGQPILASEVQGAPLFPLTLLFIAIPSPWFWNVFCLVRLVLIGMGTYLFASRVLGFRRFGAIVFTLSFGYSVYALRWMNHAWQNGFCAGVWYFYFIGRILDCPRSSLVGVGIGAIASAYSLITCGFPEASALIGVLSVFLFAPQFVTFKSMFSGWRSRITKLNLFTLLGAHGIAFSLASPQLFALLEYLGTVRPPYRESHGAMQFSSPGFLLKTIARITDDAPQIPIVHTFNLIPIFLCFMGIMCLKKHSLLRGYTLSAIALLLFFILKLFPVWPWFNLSVGSLPILKNCLFTTYFFPLLLLPFAFFAAKGGDYLSIISPIKIYICAAAALFLIVVSCSLQPSTLLFSRVVFALVPFLILVVYCVLINRTTKSFKAIALLLLIIEFIGARPMGFGLFSTPNHQAVSDAILRAQLKVHELRDRSWYGEFLDLGIATIDMGSPPIIPSRMFDFRSHLFTPVWEPFGPSIVFKEQRVPYAWQVASTSLYFDGRTRIPEYRHTIQIGEFEENPLLLDQKALGRAYIPSRCVFAYSQEDALSKLKNESRFQLGDAIIENAKDGMKKTCHSLKPRTRTVPIVEDLGSKLVLAEVLGPSIIIINDSFYDGWQAFDSTTGERLLIHPANLVFRAVELTEARKYSIQLRYIPKWWQTSLAFVIFGIASLFSAIFYIKRSRSN